MLQTFFSSPDIVDAVSIIAVFSAVTILFYLVNARRERRSAHRRWQDELRARGA
jgi:hypothetical protein